MKRNEYRNNLITNREYKPIMHKKGKQWIVLGLSFFALLGLGIGINANINPVQNTFNITSSIRNVHAIQDIAQNMHMQLIAKADSTGANQTEKNIPVGNQPTKSSQNDLNLGDVSPTSGSCEGLNYSINQEGVVTFSGSTGFSVLNNFISNAPRPINTARDIIFSNVTFSGADSATNMFSGDNNLEHMTFNGFKVSNLGHKPDISHMFSDLSNLRDVTFEGNNDFSGASKLDHLFYNDPNLKSLDFSHAKFGGNTSMSNMISKDPALTTITLGNQFDTSDVTNMSNMISSDAKLTSINLGKHFDAQKVTDMTNRFDDNSALTTIDMSDIKKTGNVTSMAGMFQNDYKLTPIDVSTFDTTNVKNFSNMFLSDKAVTNIRGLTHLNTAKGSDMQGMFDDNPNLETLDLSSFNTSNVSNMMYLYSLNGALTSLILGSDFDTSKAYDANQMTLDFTGTSTLVNINIKSPRTYFTEDSGLNGFNGITIGQKKDNRGSHVSSFVPSYTIHWTGVDSNDAKGATVIAKSEINNSVNSASKAKLLNLLSNPSDYTVDNYMADNNNLYVTVVKNGKTKDVHFNVTFKHTGAQPIGWQPSKEYDLTYTYHTSDNQWHLTSGANPTMPTYGGYTGGNLSGTPYSIVSGTPGDQNATYAYTQNAPTTETININWQSTGGADISSLPANTTVPAADTKTQIEAAVRELMTKENEHVVSCSYDTGTQAATVTVAKNSAEPVEPLIPTSHFQQPTFNFVYPHQSFVSMSLSGYGVPSDDYQLIDFLDRVSDPEVLQPGQCEYLKGGQGDVIVSRPTNKSVQGHFKYLKVNHDLYGHRFIGNVGKNDKNAVHIKAGTELQLDLQHIYLVLVMHGQKSYTVVRYEIHFHGHNYFITGEPYYNDNLYVTPSYVKKVMNKHPSRVYLRSHGHKFEIRVITNCCLYKRTFYNKRTFIRNIHAGETFTVKKINNLGATVTRFKVGPHAYITANKNYIEVL